MKTFNVGSLSENEITQYWQAALAGDRASFQKLLEGTYDLMYQYGQKFTRDPELVKDAIQDVFLGILEKRATVNASIPPKPYLLASLRRRLHRLGQRGNWLLDSGVDHGFDFDIEFSSEYYFIISEENRHLAQQITSLMNALPARQKEVIYLRFFQDLDRDEIAGIMHIRPQSVSNLLQSAFKWLREQWKPAISVFLALLFQ
ncbi:RNA polymerase sigma factor [Dyadobacter crusticola]|uniref:RNA polymerase sigma factor n=1 Tax=Dyadobacter crusticola TaxID=292407 RepID=UPI0004E0B3C9|nr:sigma-70 family RNA polymerase sigma factor [Dyadobacter crusticola]